MIVTLKNDLLTVNISSHGAELQNIVNNRTGKEYLWQGDSKFWGRRSPVLFPIVGAVWNGNYRMDGNIYCLSQHGFARDCEFDLVESDNPDEAWFVLKSSLETLQMFPRNFKLEIGYSLNGERLSVLWRVTNLDSRMMAFQIGAHPAFNYPDYSSADPVHGYFNFNKRIFTTERIAEKGCVGSESVVLETDEDCMLALGRDTFAHDAIIVGSGQLHRVSLLDKDRRPYLTVLFNSPVVGLWSPPAGNAPFVCIEPWWGRCDKVGYAGDFTQKDYVCTLSPGEIFNAAYFIVIDNV